MTDFKELTKQAITLFHLQDLPNLTIPIKERPANAIKLLNELETVLSKKDKELAIIYYKGSKAYQNKDRESISILRKCDQILSSLKDAPPNEVEKIKKEFQQKHKKAQNELNSLFKKDKSKKQQIKQVVNEIESIVIPLRNEIVNLINKWFWAKTENDKRTIDNEYLNKLKELIAYTESISKAKCKTYCIATYAKLHQFKHQRPPLMMEGSQPIEYPIIRLEWHGTYLTPTEKKIATIGQMKFKAKHLNKIAYHLENNQIKRANTFYNDHQKKIKQKEYPNNRYLITYPYHKYKMDAKIEYSKGTITLPFKAFFGPDVRDNRYNEPLVYFIIVNDIKIHTGQKLNNETTPPTTNEMPTGSKEKPHEPNIYMPCEILKQTNAKLTYLIGIGELDKIIKQCKVDGTNKKANVEWRKKILYMLKNLSYTNAKKEKIYVFKESDFFKKPSNTLHEIKKINLSDNKGIFKNVKDYLKYRNSNEEIPHNTNYPVTTESIQNVVDTLKLKEFKQFESAFNSNLKH